MLAESGERTNAVGMRPLLDLVLPVECAGCGQRGVIACHEGLRELAAHARPSWPRPSPPRLPPPWSVAAYDGHVRDFLLAYKEDGVVALRAPLALALASSLRSAMPLDDRPVVVVPVPSSRAARRRRGSDVVADLARSAVRVLRIDGERLQVRPALHHARRVADSAGLTAEQRSANLEGAFAVRPRYARSLLGSRVVLVDDLLTTGVTLRECADSLRSAGAEVVGAATVAATRRHRHPV